MLSDTEVGVLGAVSLTEHTGVGHACKPAATDVSSNADPFPPGPDGPFHCTPSPLPSSLFFGFTEGRQPGPIQQQHGVGVREAVLEGLEPVAQSPLTMLSSALDAKMPRPIFRDRSEAELRGDSCGADSTAACLPRDPPLSLSTSFPCLDMVPVRDYFLVEMCPCSSCSAPSFPRRSGRATGLPARAPGSPRRPAASVRRHLATAGGAHRAGDALAP